MAFILNLQLVIAIYSKLISCSIPVELTCSRALTDNIQAPFLKEQRSTFYKSFDKRNTKIVTLHTRWLMDNAENTNFVNKSVNLKFLYWEFFWAEGFQKLFDDSFKVINASDAESMGTHWLISCKSKISTGNLLCSIQTAKQFRWWCDSTLCFDANSD